MVFYKLLTTLHVFLDLFPLSLALINIYLDLLCSLLVIRMQIEFALFLYGLLSL